MNKSKYQDQHVIITGGSSGIGKATAKLLAQQGANITIIARDRTKLTTAQQEIESVKVKSTQQILTLVADVAQAREITTAIQQAIAQLGTPEILITSAGIARPGYFAELPLEVYEKTMAVNYFGTLYSITAVVPAMEQQQRGKIVMIASGAGLIGIYGYSAYCPSKFALRGLAESLRGELKPQGIEVKIVYPPDTDTPQLIEENKTKPPETQLITGSAKTWQATAIAQEILKGLNRRSMAIAPGLEMSLINKFHSLLLPILNWYFDLIVDKVRQQHKN